VRRPGDATVPWPEPVARVSAFVRDAGGEARIEEFAGGTPTAQAAADAIGCELACIVKSLVFLCDGRPVVALVPGNRRGDPRKIAAAVGAQRAHVAGPELVVEATGFEPGAVAPFPLPRVQWVLIDTSILAHETVWIGAGSTRHMAGLAPTELVRLARANPVQLTRDD
jgi:prolyl-tRNA editing enzyme YbaK/EbsC (Cys-tRNA(Pro) deacylase)